MRRKRLIELRDDEGLGKGIFSLIPAATSPVFV
jgi:hypothetical protein